MDLPPATCRRAPLELVSLARRWQGVGSAEDDEPEPPELAQWGAESGSRAAQPAAWLARRAASGFAAAVAAARPVRRCRSTIAILITESDEGVVVIDQHALHERILYEHLREKVLAGALESQNLLVPEPVDLSPAEAAAALEPRDVLARLGVIVEPFGGDTVLVSSYPAMLANLNPAEILRDLVDQSALPAAKQPASRRDLARRTVAHDLLQGGDQGRRPADAARKSAALVEQRHLAQDTHHCPHGRPTALVFTREELDRQFKRKG